MAASILGAPSAAPGPGGLTDTAGRGILSFLKQLAELSLIAGALLYLSGWSYLFGYFRAFGLTVGDLTLPVQVALVFSAPVVLNFTSISLISTVLVVGSLALGWITKKLQSGWIPGIVLLILLLVAGRTLSDYGISKGDEKARLNIVSTTSELPIIILSLKNNDVPFSCNDGEDRLLLHANSNYYVFNILPTSINHGSEPKQLSVCIVPESNVQSAKLRAAL